MRVARAGRVPRNLLQGKLFPFAAGAVVAVFILTILQPVHHVPRRPTAVGRTAPKTPQNVPLRHEVETSHSKAVREAFTHAWGAYKRYAWGGDELKPVSRQAKNWCQEKGSFGLSILESMDTLWIMGLIEDFEECVEWVTHHLHFAADCGISHFEATIRILGGLLSAYEVSEESYPVLLAKAQDLGERLLAAYNTSLGIPWQIVNLRTGASYNPAWMNEKAALSEIGSVQLEFKTLSYHTNNPIYRNKVEHIMNLLEEQSQQLDLPGLFPVWVDMETGEFIERHFTLGARGDSFYEILLKQWLLTGKQEVRYERLFRKAARAIEKHLMFRSSPSGLAYIAELKDYEPYHTMDHLVCFAGGMFALAAEEWPSQRSRWLTVAEELGETCHAMYAMTATKLGPEIVDFENDRDMVPHSWKYLLRPEAVETWFYLWRVTKDQKWRDYGAQMLRALNIHCWVDGGGYSGIRNVSQLPAEHDDLMQSFFLSETLKYLFLLFQGSGILPLHEWVFTTEAHPLRRRKTFFRS